MTLVGGLAKSGNLEERISLCNEVTKFLAHFRKPDSKSWQSKLRTHEEDQALVLQQKGTADRARRRDRRERLEKRRSGAREPEELPTQTQPNSLPGQSLKSVDEIAIVRQKAESRLPEGGPAMPALSSPSTAKQEAPPGAFITRPRSRVINPAAIAKKIASSSKQRRSPPPTLRFGQGQNERIKKRKLEESAPTFSPPSPVPFESELPGPTPAVHLISSNSSECSTPPPSHSSASNRHIYHASSPAVSSISTSTLVPVRADTSMAGLLDEVTKRKGGISSAAAISKCLSVLVHS